MQPCMPPTPPAAGAPLRCRPHADPVPEPRRLRLCHPRTRQRHRGGGGPQVHQAGAAGAAGGRRRRRPGCTSAGGGGAAAAAAAAVCGCLLLLLLLPAAAAAAAAAAACCCLAWFASNYAHCPLALALACASLLQHITKYVDREVSPTACWPARQAGSGLLSASACPAPCVPVRASCAAAPVHPPVHACMRACTPSPPCRSSLTWRLQIANHMRLRHPHIIALHEVFLTKTHLVLAMEYAAGGRGNCIGGRAGAVTWFCLSPRGGGDVALPAVHRAGRRRHRRSPPRGAGSGEAKGRCSRGRRASHRSSQRGCTPTGSAVQPSCRAAQPNPTGPQAATCFDMCRRGGACPRTRPAGFSSS